MIGEDNINNSMKEFIMADAYSFDSDDGGLDISYDKMFQAFKNIFNRKKQRKKIAL